MGGLVSMAHRSPARGRLLCGFADGFHLVSPGQDSATAFMDRSVLNDKSAPFQRKAKSFVGRGLLGINPDNQHTRRTQELYQPIKRELQGFERGPPPINQCHVVLAGWLTAVCRGCSPRVAATMQIQHQLDGPGPGHDDTLLFRTACKPNHWFKDAVACGGATRGSHDVTILFCVLELRGDRAADPRPGISRKQSL
jgi:hypothetical protein